MTDKILHNWQNITNFTVVQNTKKKWDVRTNKNHLCAPLKPKQIMHLIYEIIKIIVCYDNKISDNTKINTELRYRIYRGYQKSTVENYQLHMYMELPFFYFLVRFLTNFRKLILNVTITKFTIFGVISGNNKFC